jgi:hypothetical protein
LSEPRYLTFEERSRLRELVNDRLREVAIGMSAEQFVASYIEARRSNGGTTAARVFEVAQQRGYGRTSVEVALNVLGVADDRGRLRLRKHKPETRGRPRKNETAEQARARRLGVQAKP